MQGFVVFDRHDQYQKALKKLVHWVADKKIKYKEIITENIENILIFIAMMAGENYDKQLVKMK